MAVAEGRREVFKNSATFHLFLMKVGKSLPHQGPLISISLVRDLETFKFKTTFSGAGKVLKYRFFYSKAMEMSLVFNLINLGTKHFNIYTNCDRQSSNER